MWMILFLFPLVLRCGYGLGGVLEEVSLRLSLPPLPWFRAREEPSHSQSGPFYQPGLVYVWWRVFLLRRLFTIVGNYLAAVIPELILKGWTAEPYTAYNYLKFNILSIPVIYCFFYAEYTKCTCHLYTDVLETWKMFVKTCNCIKIKIIYKNKTSD